MPISAVPIDSVPIHEGEGTPEEPGTPDQGAPGLEPPALVPEANAVGEVEGVEAAGIVADEPSASAPAADEAATHEPAPDESSDGWAPDESSDGWAPDESYSAATRGATFDLQFSTGESAIVTGSGLLGRRPLPQPSEVFDQLIQISDTGMSVSKSHLEFGQEDGELWVSDRFSGNGTIILRPGEGAVRCEPGRRYRVPRGTRVEIADQFFILR
ncbi:MAG: hypothetical protein ABJB33_10775 [Gemmatimonadota bacterium]